MKRRVGIWATMGVLVAVFWAIYAALTFPQQMIAQPELWMLAEITCPIAYASLHFHFGVKLYWVLIANAVTYAAIGVIFEGVRHEFRHA